MVSGFAPPRVRSNHRVKEGLLDVSWIEDTADFGYAEPQGGRTLLELAPVPSWHELQYRG